MSAPVIRYVLVNRFCEETGYTPKAVERKIASGAWTEGFQFRRSPDGRIQIDMERAGVDRIPQSLPAAEIQVGLVSCGVYLLYNDGALAYVGRSTSLASRLAHHRASGRLFGEARIIPCDEALSVWLERELIRTLQPPQNIVRYARSSAEAAHTLALAGLR